jgi:BMFP domain-containing protein YqiC
MVGALREELRSSQQLNAELRNRMQLLEQRLKRLEAR